MTQVENERITIAVEKWAISAISALIIVVFSGAVLLVALGKPVTDLLMLAGLLVVPTVTSFLTLLRVERVGRDVAQVVTNTNGRMTDLIGRIPQAPTAPTAGG